ncbi:SRPBCC domain-containing protein [Candidatus Woesebacteria bacterium]|nr:SRPBCC domain-containing protein [Candidatus Woesebacteria bacterium]
MQDIITRVIIVKATQEKVYTTITDPSHIITWFPDEVEGSMEVGERSTLVFKDFNHRAQIYVVDKKPFTYFSYRWIPGGQTATQDVLEGANTLVEFFIEEVEKGTKVTVKESGFASLPAEVAEKSFKDNTGGWDYMMKRLEKLYTQS